MNICGSRILAQRYAREGFLGLVVEWKTKGPRRYLPAKRPLGYKETHYRVIEAYVLGENGVELVKPESIFTKLKKLLSGAK